MEIAIVSPQTLRMKGKKATFLIDPTTLRTKTETDAVMLYHSNDTFDATKVVGSRLTIAGPGDYEVSFAKVSATRMGDDIVYQLTVDGLSILCCPTRVVSKLKDKLTAPVVVLFADEKVDDIDLAALEADVAVIYGQHAQTLVEKVGKGEGTKPTATNKFSITHDKLPEELQVIWLSSQE